MSRDAVRSALLAAAAVTRACGPAPARDRPAEPRADVSTKPVVEQIRTYTPGDELPEEMPELKPERVSVTACDFWCKPVLSYRVRSTTQTADGCRAVVDIASIELELELAMTTWLPDGANRRHKAHEAGHRKICRRVADRATETARDGIRAAAREPLTGSGATCDEAVEDASRRQATLRFCAPYTADSGREARRVAAYYEFILRENPRSAGSQAAAIRAAFRAYRREQEQRRDEQRDEK